MNELQQDVKKAYTFLIDPAHIILALALAGAMFAGLYLWDSKRADLADSRAQLAEAKASLVAKQNTEFQLSVAQQIAQLSNQNTVLANAISARKQELVVVQKQDAQLAPDQLAAKWATNIDAPGQILPTPLGYQVSSQAALTTLQALDELPLDRANIRDLTTQLSNSSAKYNLEVAAHGSDVVSLKTALDAKDADILQVKAEARKSKLKWFFSGVVVGFVARQFVK